MTVGEEEEEEGVIEPTSLGTKPPRTGREDEGKKSENIGEGDEKGVNG